MTLLIFLILGLFLLVVINMAIVYKLGLIFAVLDNIERSLSSNNHRTE